MSAGREGGEGVVAAGVGGLAGFAAVFGSVLVGVEIDRDARAAGFAAVDDAVAVVVVEDLAADHAGVGRPAGAGLDDDGRAGDVIAADAVLEDRVSVFAPQRAADQIGRATS